MTALQKRSLACFPVQFFAVIMGISGLTIVFAKAYHTLDYAYGWYVMLLLADTLLFFLIITLYILKWIKYPQKVKDEFKHPVKSAFAAAISISFLLLSIAYYDYAPTVSVTFWFVGAILHLLFTLVTMHYWINGEFKVAHINPAWFIPMVGNVLVPVVGVDIAPLFVNIFFFSIGLFFWVVLFTIVIYRMIFHQPLAKRLLPTFFILIAPPAVGFISYFRITFGSIDMMSLFLYAIALFTLILLLFMADTFSRLAFFISWWAYTFPLAAITIATILMHMTYHNSLTYMVSTLLILLTALVVLIVVYKTVQAINQQKICIPEED
jgi:tellurite resistance protein